MLYFSYYSDPFLRFVTADDRCFTTENKTGASDPSSGLDIAIFTSLAVIASLMLVGTLLELGPLLRPPSNLVDTTHTPDSLGPQLLKSFSLYSNGRALLATKQAGSGHMDCINGMRSAYTWHTAGSELHHPL